MAESAVASPPEVASEEECPRCGGRGWVVVADGGAGTARACDCRKQDLAERLLAASGIPPTYSRCTLDAFRTTDPDPAARDQLLKARRQSQGYVESFLRPEGGFCDHGLIYIGRTGAGKTHLAAAVLSELIRRYKLRGRFVEFTPLIHQIQSTFDPGSLESKHKILDPVIEAPVLVLDELGAQKPTPFVQDILYLIINTRYTRRLPTLFTTNYGLAEVAQGPGREGGPDPQELASRLPATLVSRLCEMAEPVRLDAVSDYRREILMPRRHN